MTNLEPQTELRNLLRPLLTDYNSSNRGSTQWVYDDWPNDTLAPSSFPRVAITVPAGSTNDGPTGLGDSSTWDDVKVQIDAIVHINTPVCTVTHTDEAVASGASNSPRINLDRLPTGGVTNVKHAGTGFTVSLVVNDSDFTAPGSLADGTVEVSRSTSNMNFSTGDLTTYAASAITSTYVESLEGMRLAWRVARDIVTAIRSNWVASFSPLHNFQLINGPVAMPHDEDRGWYRVMIEYQFKRFNTGEEV